MARVGGDQDAPPRTPLLEEGAGPQFLVPPVSTVRRRSRNTSGSTSSQIEPGPRQEGVPLMMRNRQRNKTACAGIIIFGVIIVVALVIVGIKEATSPGDATIQKLREGDKKAQSDGEGSSEIFTTPKTTTTTTAVINTTTTSDEQTTAQNSEIEIVQDQTDRSDSALQKSVLCEQLKNASEGFEPVDCDIFVGDVTLAEKYETADDYIKDLMKTDVYRKVLNRIQELSDDGVNSDADEMKNQVNLLLTGDIVVSYKMLKTMIENLTPPEQKKVVKDLFDIHTTTGNSSTYQRQETPQTRSLAKKEVFCDSRELRCADKQQCYPAWKQCDFKVDCKDFSDEAFCTCLDRLISSRKCDGQVDCPLGEDELGCTDECGDGDKFFCRTEPVIGGSECIDQARVCDGVSDCSNGRDEEDCVMLFSPYLDTDLFKPANSDLEGLVSIKTESGYKYLAFTTSTEPLIPFIAKRACMNLANVRETLVKLVEFEQDISKLVKISNYDRETRRFEFTGVEAEEHVHLLIVQCELEPCDPVQLIRVVKRGHERPEELSGLSGLEIEQLYISGNMTESMKPGGGEGAGGKIVGGITSDITTWPSTVGIYRNGEFICGGTLINTQWIITAGHCLYKPKGNHYRIRAGMQRKQSQSPWEQSRDIREVYIHNNYDSIFLSHDVALGKLDRPVSINKYAQPVCLPWNGEMTPLPGSSCTAAGWGLLSERGTEAEELKEVLLPILDDCWRTYNNVSYQICAGSERGRDSCQGDSGGPLYCFLPSGERYLGGVISHGKGCGRQGEPGVYVRLSMYYEWIDAVLSGNLEEEQIYMDQPMQSCPGLVCGSGECLAESDLCDGRVHCLDNTDVNRCVRKDGEVVYLAPEEHDYRLDKHVANLKLTDSAGFVEADELFVDDHHDHDDKDHQHDDDHDTSDVVATRDGPETDSDGNIFPLTIKTCPKEHFKCSLVAMCIPESLVCNGVIDCIDRSDEVGCSCGDKLAKTIPDLVGDMISDCTDESDEPSPCLENEYRCPMSTMCIGKAKVCDTVEDCPNGGDELNCAILVNEEFVPVVQTNDIVKNNTGYLVIQSRGSWKPVCVASFNDIIAKSVCSYIGYASGGASYSLVNGQSVPIRLFQDYYAGASCQFVEMSCQQECGTRPEIGTGITSSVSDAWNVVFLSEGQLICGGTLIHPSFVLTTRQCGVKVLKTKSRGHFYHTVLAGQLRRTPFGLSPHAQIRRLVKFKAIPQTNVAIGYVESAFELNDHVGKICLPDSRVDLRGTTCLISEATDYAWGIDRTVLINGECNRESNQDFSYCTCGDPSLRSQPSCAADQPANQEPVDLEDKLRTGILACPDKSGKFVSVGIYNSTIKEAPTNFSSLAVEAVRKAIPGLMASTRLEQAKNKTILPQDKCYHRCRIGNCVPEEDVCDGKWDCIDGSDEKTCRADTPWPMCRKEGSECTCPKGYGKCKNNMCLPMDRYCDNVDDCGDNSDEVENCLLCVNRLRFYNPYQVCDKTIHCDDGGDEAPSTCGCPEDSFRCNLISKDPTDTTNCTSLASLCDGRSDCKSGIDEATNMCIALASKFHVNQNELLEPRLQQNGYLKMRLQGKWYTTCQKDWNDNKSLLICKHLGFSGLRISQLYTPFKVHDLGVESGAPISEDASQCKLVYIVCTAGQTM